MDANSILRLALKWIADNSETEEAAAVARFAAYEDDRTISRLALTYISNRCGDEASAAAFAISLADHVENTQ